jgi:predicted kinase
MTRSTAVAFRSGEDTPLQTTGARTMLDPVVGRRLYLVCGLPGAGKTTRSRQIVERTGALHLCVDEWVVGLGMSLTDYEFRARLQACMLTHAAALLRHGVNVVLEFGSWSEAEREGIRQTAVSEGAAVELHFLDAPLDELVRRVRARGGQEAEGLITVLVRDSSKFEQPSPEEVTRFDRYVGPGDPPH